MKSLVLGCDCHAILHTNCAYPLTVPCRFAFAVLDFVCSFHACLPRVVNGPCYLVVVVVVVAAAAVVVVVVVVSLLPVLFIVSICVACFLRFLIVRLFVCLFVC